MIYKYNSDITNVKEGIIAHGVNCQMRMGSGVAKALYEKWPHVKESYLNMKNPQLGDTQIFFVEDKKLSVANCFTQEFYGTDGAIYADLDAIKRCLTIVATYYKKDIHIPLIGCGLGGLKVEDVIDVIKEVEADKGVEFTLHTL